MHIPKDERSKLDAKSRQYVFLGYGQDEFGYRFYDPMEKKLVKSRYVVFMEDQTIRDILKTDTPVLQYNNGLIDLDLVPLTHVPTEVRDVQDDQHDTGDVDIGSTPVEMGDNAYEQSPVSKVPLEVLLDVPLMRSIRN